MDDEKEMIISLQGKGYMIGKLIDPEKMRMDKNIEHIDENIKIVNIEELKDKVLEIEKELWPKYSDTSLTYKDAVLDFKIRMMERLNEYL